MRLNVGAGEKLMVGGFIIEGTEPKRVVVRASGHRSRRLVSQTRSAIRCLS